MRLRGFRFFLVTLLLMIAAAAVPLAAQTAGTGAIAGTVNDTSGAVIPGATVGATNTDTGQQRTVTTGADGSYKFALLPPGTYTLKFSASGFKTTEVPRVTVAVTETPVLDQKLELGTQAEQVTVEANVEAIQTTNAALGTVLGSSQVVGLPLASRDFTNIMALSAGVSAGVTNAGLLGKGGMDMAVNGAGVGSNNIQIDGLNIATMTGNNGNTDSFSGTNGTTPVPNPDSLQEFKVQTSSYDAGYGRNSGANINIVTKSGTNAFHGTVFEFFRNTVLNANDFFLNLSGKATPVLNQNQFGGVLGGPIRKDRLFFFGSYQGTTQVNGFASQGKDSIILPPLPAGDRSNTAVFQAALGAAMCPANRGGNAQYNTLRGGVQVACDGSNINPVAMNLLQFKLPTGLYLFPGSTTGAFQNSNNSIPARYHENQEMGNADYIMSARHTLALRFFNSYAPSDISFVNLLSVPGTPTALLYFDTTALAKVTSVLTPSLVNEFRVSFHRDFVYAKPNFNLSDHQFGIQPVSPYQDYNLPGFMSQLQITGAYTIGINGNGQNATTATAAYQMGDQLSWTRGKHTIRTGFEIEQLRWDWNYPGLGQGNIMIPTFADFLIGRAGCTPSDTTCNAANPGITNGTTFSNISATMAADGLGPAGNPHSWRIWDIGAFVNDDLKLTPSLTLNLGLRYDYNGQTTEIYGTQSNVWPSAILTVPVPGTTPATGSLAGWVVPHNYHGTYASDSQGNLLPGITRSPTNSSLESGPQKNGFEPRIGFAWQPFGGSKFVVRGGYGFFYDRVPSIPFVATLNLSPPLAPPADKSGVSNYYATLAVPFGPTANVFPTRWVNFPALTSSGFNQYAYGPNWRMPLIQSYNLGVQYNFLPSWVLEVGWVGSHGLHLATGGTDKNINQANLASAANPVWGLTTNTVSNAILRVPYLGFGTIMDHCTCQDSKFNSLQVTLRKQFSHGLQVQAAYTWARAFTDAPLTQDLNNYAQNYGLSSVYHPQRVVINYSYALPFGNPKGFAGKLITGWSLSGVTTIQDGTPLTITDSRGGTIYNIAGSRAQILGTKTYGDIATPGDLKSRLGGATGGCGYFTAPTTSGTLNGATCGSLSAFTTVPVAVAPDGTVTNGTGWGNTGIGLLLGPGQLNFDAALSKLTKVGGIHEDSTLQFRAEFFNAFNHAQFANPGVAVAAGTFGQITSATVNPRLIQLALKYIF